MKPLRVLVAEDSTTVRGLLVAMMNGDPALEVVGEANNGREAVDLTEKLRPDVINMDIQMPVMDGFQATKEIMMATPTPIVIVSGHVDVREVAVSMQALSAGALAVLPKPVGPRDPDFRVQQRRLLRTLKTMAAVKVVRHWRERGVAQSDAARIPSPPLGISREVVAIAISTGGPAALQQLLTALPRDFPAPILVVQHIAQGFVGGLIAWLDSVSSLRVKLAKDGDELLDSTVYLAPDNAHMRVSKEGRILLSSEPRIGGFRPSANPLFDSVAEVFGKSSVCVIMTGMGNDGVAGLEAVRKAGGRIVAQDESTSVVFGMPGAAIEAGLPDVVLPLAAIVSQLSAQVYYEQGGQRQGR